MSGPYKTLSKRSLHPWRRNLDSLTVVIATRNRAEYLRRCLQSLTEQRASLEWSILIVDNGSSDHTPEIVEEYAARGLSCTRVYEPKLGTSRARNHARDLTGTTHLLFMDDDSIAPPNYLATAARIGSKRQSIAFYGPIYPFYLSHAPKPNWFRDEYGAYSLSSSRPGATPPEASAANLFVRHDAFCEVKGFPESFGPRGRKMGFGEENLMCMALRERYGPNAVTYHEALFNLHTVRPERYRWSFAIRENMMRGYYQGKVAAAVGSNSLLNRGYFTTNRDFRENYSNIKKERKYLFNYAYEYVNASTRIVSRTASYILHSIL